MMRVSLHALLPGIVAVVIGLAAIAGGSWAKLHEMNIQENGVRAVALVTDVWEEYDSEDGTSYWISYEYTPPGSRAIEGETSLDYEVWKNHVPRESDIGVTYLPDSPAVHSVDGSWSDIFFYALVILGAIFAIAGSTLLVFRLRR